MNNPLDFRQFEHFLNFKSDNTGLFQFSEPLKFDASEFVITQDDKGYARDISFMAEEVSLEFYDGFFEPTDAYQLTNGVVVNFASQGLEAILRYNKDYGFQSEIEYILRRNGVDFILGELNFEGAETDETTYFKCKVVQSTKRALARRREDTEIDVFATEDLDGNAIEPLATENLLLQAKPITQASEWQLSGSLYAFSINNFVSYSNNFGSPITAGIENTLSGSLDRILTTFNGDSDYWNKVYDFGYVDAQEDLTNVNINLDNLKVSFYIPTGSDFETNWIPFSESRPFIQFTILPIGLDNYTQSDVYPSGNNATESYDLDYEAVFVGNENVNQFPPFTGNSDRYDVTFNLNQTLVNQIPRSHRLCITFIFNRNNTIYNWLQGDFNISATSTSIDTVVKCVNYIDLAKQSLKAINGMELTANEFTDGGQFDNLVALSGNLIRQRDDVPFYTNFKDRKENLVVMNSDIQINTNDAFVLKYNKFYDNVENAFFEVDPSSESTMTYNQKYAVNLLEWTFKDYEKDRDEENTLDAVHTEAQFSINNTKVKNTKKIDVSDIYDPFRIEVQRKQAFKETTALDGDDKIHVLDTVTIAPGTKKGFSASMQHQITENDEGVTVLKILKDAELPSWALLGFNVGSSFWILSSDNYGEYEVSEIDNTILTLIPISPSTQTFEGPSYTQVEYPLENVLLTNRTDEGFTLIENLLNPTNFSNLRYTIRRNLVHWEEYISTCASYISDNPKNTKFVNNGALVTQFEDSATYTEDGDIDLSTIQSAILTPKTYDITIKAGYDEVLELIKKYEDIETAGGFIRCKFVDGSIKKVYPSKLGYTWATEKLNILGEERFEGDVVTVNRVDGIIEINDVGYPQISTESLFYENNGEYFSILDENKEKIINFTKYNKFVVQEETFDNVNDLAQALIDL